MNVEVPSYVPEVILVVDDKEAKRYVATRILEAAGYRVLQASNGRDALKVASTSFPHLMVLDIKLPDIDGFEVCRIIKSTLGTSYIPVLHYSATLNSSEIRVHGLDGGADAFLTHDAKPEELVATVRALLRMRNAEMELRRRNMRLEIISRAAEDVLASPSSEGMLRNLFREVQLHCEMDAYFMFRMNESDGNFELESSEGITEMEKAQLRVVLASKSLSGVAVMTRTTVYSANIAQSTEAATSTLKALGYNCCVVSPLLAGDKILGTLSFASRRRHELSKEELDFLRLLARYAALAREKFMILKDAQQANMRKDDFLAHMSHEIRTPMNAIIGIGHLLASSNPVNDRQKELISTLRTSADSLLGLINDVLDTAKIESESMILERTPFSLFELASEIVEMAKINADAKGISVTLTWSDDVPREYVGDPTRVRQIILNLVINAIKFTEIGSVRISITLSDDAETDGMVLITVADTGVGIPTEKLNAVFSKFQQADTTITRKFGGTGLGLAITKALTLMMDGKITVKSELGRGSVFTVALPLMELPRDVQTLAEVKVTNGMLAAGNRRKRVGTAPLILLAEDYFANRLVLTELFEILGFDYEIAENGREAIDALMDKKYDVVLMDVQMPEVDGLEATRTIRKSNGPNAMTPIIGVTAFASHRDRDRCLECGMDDYISKPFDANDLAAKIHLFLELSKRITGT